MNCSEAEKEIRVEAKNLIFVYAFKPRLSGLNLIFLDLNHTPSIIFDNNYIYIDRPCNQKPI